MILVDDGLATGATMRAAVKAMRQRGATKIVVAVPVGPPDTCHELAQQADETICLSTPPFFQAVGQYYEDFSQTSDDDVRELLTRAAQEITRRSQLTNNDRRANWRRESARLDSHGAVAGPAKQTTILFSYD